MPSSGGSAQCGTSGYTGGYTGTVADAWEQQLKPLYENALELICNCPPSPIVKQPTQAYSLFSLLFTCCSS